MLDLSVSNVLHSNLFNFVIMVIILYSLFKKPLSQAVSDTEKKTVDEISSSVKKKELSLKDLKSKEELIRVLPRDKKNIVDTAKTTLDALKRKDESLLQSESESMRVSSDRKFEERTRSAISNLTESTAGASVGLAKNKIEAMLVENPDLHDKIVEKIIEEM